MAKKTAWKQIRPGSSYEHRDSGYRVAVARTQWCILLPLPPGAVAWETYRDTRGLCVWFPTRWAAQQAVEDMLEGSLNVTTPEAARGAVGGPA